jgi:hypothetical protein
MTHVTHVLQSTCHCEKVETPPTRAQSRCFRTSFCTVRWWRLASEVQTTVGTWSGWELNSIFSVCRKFLYVYVKSFDSPRWEWENHYSDPYLVGCCSYPKDSTCSDSDGCAKLTAAVGSLRHAANWKHQAHAIVFSAPRIAPKTTANSLGFPTITWGYVPRYAPGIPTQSRRRRYHSYSVCPNYPVNKNPLLWTFARGLESEFAIAGPLICVFRVWFVKSDVLVDLYWPNETLEHLLAKKSSCDRFVQWKGIHFGAFLVLIHWSEANKTHETHGNGNWHTLPTFVLHLEN